MSPNVDPALPAAAAGAPAQPALPAQEIHLWLVALAVAAPEPPRGAAIRLPFAPTYLDPGASQPSPEVVAGAGSGAVVMPFFNHEKQLRLLASFGDRALPTVNGEPAPRVVVLSPGDLFQWTAGVGYRVALFCRPQIGPPPAAALGKLCPVCRVPFTAESSCYVCLCGAVLHCSPDASVDELQCARLRRECPACRRPIVLAEGYITPAPDED